MSILIIGELKIIDHSNNPDVLTFTESGSLGIDEARQIKAFLMLRPIGAKKEVIIYNAENLTEEAQNALLKILEEPPKDSEITLVAKDEDQILPTIRSRCQIIYTASTKPSVSKEAEELIKKLPTLTVPEKLTLAKNFAKKREQAIEFIDSLLIATRGTRPLFRAKKLLKANCNVRLVIENLFLNW